MIVCKWGNSLGVRLPVKLIEELGLKAGDEVEIVAGQGDLIAFKAKSNREKWDAFFAKCDRQPSVPDDYVWSRDEANAR